MLDFVWCRGRAREAGQRAAGLRRRTLGARLVDVLQPAWLDDIRPLPAAAPAAPRCWVGNVTVRDARVADMQAIQGIYAHHVRRGLASFEEVPPTTREMRDRRVEYVGLGLPYLVAEAAGRVVGFSFASPYRVRPAYRHTVQDSVYVAAGLGGQGIGGALLRQLIARCEIRRLRQMVAIVGDSGNTASIQLHRRFGFREVGTLQAVGFKHGRWVDSVLMQRRLGPGCNAEPSTAAR